MEAVGIVLAHALSPWTMSSHSGRHLNLTGSRTEAALDDEDDISQNVHSEIAMFLYAYLTALVEHPVTDEHVRTSEGVGTQPMI